MIYLLLIDKTRAPNEALGHKMPNFNAFMHRRNIFRKEPDFNNLACDYQELKQYMTVGSKNKPKFDFKNPDALRAMTRALLHRYFQKRITIPSDRMIPAVPQRLNYICWVEDLVKLVELQTPDHNIVGLDIGTGASCIFPILSCHRNPTWSFVGVEADQKSYIIAHENVLKNFMDDRIRILKITTDDTLNDILCLSSYPITFIMCNPPFFEEEYGIYLEMNPNVRTGRPKSRSNTSDSIESVVGGGEIAFVGHMLEQSRHFKEEVTIYTSMLGKRQSLTHFKQTLSSLNEDNLSWTWAELCQGKTIRYAIAWTFKPGLDLTRAPPLRHGKNKSWKFKLLRKMPKRDCQLELLENSEFLKNLISRELMIARTRVTRQTPQTFEMLIKTNDKTWTNQRRKKREQQNKHKHPATHATVSGYASVSSSNIADSSMSSELVVESVDGQATASSCDTSKSIFQSCSGANTVLGEMASQEPSTMHAEMCTSTDAAMQTNTQYDVAKQQSASANSQQSEQSNIVGMDVVMSSKKRKNPSSCSSSPPRVCPSPNDELTDDDNQSTDNSSSDGGQTDNDTTNTNYDIKRLRIKEFDDNDNMDDLFDYLLCCRISLTRVCRDLYFELKLEHPCASASDAYDLFQYFRNKLSDK